jgi:hypothetical protein
MDLQTDSNFACYRSDYRPSDRCANGQAQASIPSLTDPWLYSSTYIPSQALADRPQLQPLYTLQRPADQNYPSPSPSVPSPGPRLSPQLDLASQALGGFPSEQPSDFSSRESDVGPVRSLRNHQYGMDYRPSRRTSMSDPQVQVTGLPFRENHKG